MASQIQSIVADHATVPNLNLLPAERVVYSREIELAAMDLLRLGQFALEKTELNTQPGLSIEL